MDEIFHKTTNVFDVVKIARETPRRYGRKGELLVRYEDTEEYADAQRRRSTIGAPERRRSSVAAPPAKDNEAMKHVEHVDLPTEKRKDEVQEGHDCASDGINR